MEELAQKATIRPDTFRLPPAVSIVVVNSLETRLAKPLGGLGALETLVEERRRWAPAHR